MYILKNSNFYLYIKILLTFSLLQKSKANIPNCDFMDTVNLSGYKKYSNGSYDYEGILIPKNLTGEYNYDLKIEQNEEFQISVPTHMRGCVCKIKSCIRFCCHPKAKMDDTECLPELHDHHNYSPYFHITFENDTEKKVDIFKDFVIQQAKYCSYTYFVEDDYKLYENGTLWLDETYTKQHYCLAPKKISDKHELALQFCGEEVLSDNTKFVCMTISCVFIVLNVAVHLFLPILRTLHGKCLISYLSALFVSFTLMAIAGFQTVKTTIICTIIGYVTYYFIMAAFMWLNVISYDLWCTFNSARFNISKKRFIYYSMYAWGVPVLLCTFTALAQYNFGLEGSWNPEIGIEACFLANQSYALLIYLYIPCILILIINTVFFVLTYVGIYNGIKEMEHMSRDNNNIRPSTPHINNFLILLRLFVLTGIYWLLEIFSYFFEKQLVVFCSFVDKFNALIGLFLFVLLITKNYKDFWHQFKKLISKFRLETPFNAESNFEFSNSDHNKK